MNNFLRNVKLRGPARRWARMTSGIAVGALLLSTGVVKAQLSGTYTICPSGCTYSTIQGAATDLKNKGISASVTMEIKAGAYNEAVTVGSISGVSATKTVTFKGMGSKPTDTRIYHSTIPWTFNSASRVTLENVHAEVTSYSSGNYAVYFTGSSNCTFRNSRATGSTTGSVVYNHDVLRLEGSSDILVQGNYLRGGGYNTINIPSGGVTNATFDNNIITKWGIYAIYVYGASGNKYTNNTIDSGAYGSPTAGLYLYQEAGNMLVKGNIVRAGNAYYPIFPYYPQSTGVYTIDSNQFIGGYYGIYTYGPGSGNHYTITRNRVRNMTYYGILMQTYGNVECHNNMVDVSSSGYYALYMYPYASSCVWNVTHNTAYQAASSYYGIYYYNSSGAKSIKLMNNLIQGPGAPCYLYPVTGNIIDHNNFVRTAGGSYGYVNGISVANFSALNTAIINAVGNGYNNQNVQITYANAPTDLHLDHTNPAPFGTGVGIGKDYDDDVRCAIMPTIGADETKNKTGDNYKTITGTKFTGSSKAIIGYPTIYFNSAPSTSKLGYRWYVDGVKVSDSFHLRTTALKWPKGKIKLEAYNCSSVDSFVMNVTVDSPATAPTSDFISDLNVVRQGDVVQFTDLSTGYPSSWEWEITPQSGILNGNPAAAYKYVYGSKTTDMNKVRFDIPGKYKVCLTASNVKGKGNQECKVDYIEVTPAVTMTTSLQILTASSGYIYDNGGPNGNVQAAYYYNTLPKVLIDACADSVYLVFKSFQMYCPYQYLRVYEGKDKQTGKPLSCTGNMYSGVYGPGLTGWAGSTCAQNCSPIRNGATTGTFVYDTFRASKYMYLEMEANTTGAYTGFEIYYWTKPRSQPKPDASFTSVDSICTNGQVVFTNTTKGSDVTYLWDLDDDMSFFEATSKNTNWPYFAPGQYKITLIAMNCGGVDTATKTINVFNPKAPVVAFTADNLTPTTNDVVFLSKDMPMCLDEYLWTITAASGSGKANYVNGTKNTSALPQVMFTDTGCYNVKLEAKNVSGTDALQLNCFIKVRGSYCIPSTINKAADLGISKVKFHTLENSSPQGAASYTNYAVDQTKTTTIEIGVTYDLTVERNTNKNKITRTAWIDWNVDGDFDDAGEKVGEQTNSSSLSWTTQVKVPTLAKVGATLMRIAVNQGTQTNTPCGPNVFGEFEDYRVYVRPDASKPVITMLGDDTVYVEQGYTYTDAGATATDNLDGNVTSKIKVTSLPKFDNMVPGTYTWKYNVIDAAGNQADEVRRVVIVTPDKTAPNLVVPDPETIYVEVFDATFSAPDAVLAEDLVDGDLLSEVQKTGNVDVNVVGTYEIVYTVTDASNNTATVKRIVVVQDITNPTMVLNGNATVQHEVGTKYTDDDVTISDNYYSETQLRAKLVVQSNVDENKLGTYTVVYTLTDPSGNGPVTETRTVIVVDTQDPIATLKGTDPYVMEVNNMFDDPGVTITDNYDPNLTTWDTTGTFYATFPTGFANQLGTYTVIYTVTDASGNTDEVTRTVVVKDMTAPKAELKGEPGVTACRWAKYDDAGYSVSDNYNTAAQLTITPEGTFTTYGTQVAGLWSLRYKVVDQSGNVAYTDWRAILVMEPGLGGCTNVGIKDGESMDKYVNVYPNPNTGKFTVDVNLPASEQVKITVTNLVGQQIAVVADGMMSANTLAVDLSAQPAGVYMLNIQTATQNVVKRIVINK